MKKLISVLLVILTGITFVSCAKVNPEDEVSAFLDALKNKDTETLSQYVDNEHINMLINSTGDQETLNGIYDNLFKNLSFEVLSINAEDKDNIVVSVKISNCNFKQAFANYEKKSYDYMLGALYSSKITKEKMEEKCLQIFAKEIEAASNSNTKAEATIDIKLVKNSSNNYKVAVDEPLMDAVTGGLVVSAKAASEAQ